LTPENNTNDKDKKSESKEDLPNVTVIIPTLNEEQSIGQTLDEIPKDFANLEIMIVDGLSKDHTIEIAKEKGARVVIEKRKGYGRAYKTGFKEAKGDIIATLDGDTTYPAYDIPRVVKMLLDEDLDFITCDRLSTLSKEAMTKGHRFGNWVLAKTTNILFNMHIKDSQSGMWIFKKEILKKINLCSDGMPLSQEIKIEVFKNKEIKAKEIPVEYRIRIGDIKLNTWGDGIGNWKYLWRKRFRKKTLTPEKF
jgi:glycosyltransferase involved in cell wall biosynthesis